MIRDSEIPIKDLMIGETYRCVAFKEGFENKNDCSCSIDAVHTSGSQISFVSQIVVSLIVSIFFSIYFRSLYSFIIYIFQETYLKILFKYLKNSSTIIMYAKN